jgi:hypothetical protein
MNCCTEPTPANLQQAGSGPVMLRTMLLILKPERFGQVGEG